MHILVSIYNIKFISFFFFAFIKTISLDIYILHIYIHILYKYQVEILISSGD